jgi:hypothetical protein
MVVGNPSRSEIITHLTTTGSSSSEEQQYFRPLQYYSTSDVVVASLEVGATLCVELLRCRPVGRLLLNRIPNVSNTPLPLTVANSAGATFPPSS